MIDGADEKLFNGWNWLKIGRNDSIEKEPALRNEKKRTIKDYTSYFIDFQIKAKLKWFDSEIYIRWDR